MCAMTVQEATNQQEWDAFLCAQRFSPFLQSWTMGEVYRDTGQEPIRLEVRDGDELLGICQAVVVPAKRGKHLAIPYGPILTTTSHQSSTINPLLQELRQIAQAKDCTFIRISPFWPVSTPPILGTKSSPLHLLAEHIWYLPLTEPNLWKPKTRQADQRMTPRSQEEILQEMRQNTRNLIRRAEREGVAVMASDDPVRDLSIFIDLHEETRKRHHFTPYTNEFFRSQVKRFSERHECTLYLARYQGEIIATSIHMHMGGETSYHHGASTHKHAKIPASYLLQWTAIHDAIERGDHVYNFWGIAPEGVQKHPFHGVTTFKTGFGGELMELTHCSDLPLKPTYYATRAFETWRRWKRGF